MFGSMHSFGLAWSAGLLLAKLFKEGLPWSELVADTTPGLFG